MPSGSYSDVWIGFPIHCLRFIMSVGELYSLGDNDPADVSDRVKSIKIGSIFAVVADITKPGQWWGNKFSHNSASPR